MRYQNWDVLMFPDQCKIPLQEYKTSCQVIQDTESHHSQANPLLLPTVTSFIPGLPTGSPFRISIHCWQNPEISRYIQNLRKSTDSIVFEARVIIDGRVAGSKWFNQNGPWPSILDLSIELDKHGEFEKLKFPTFHKELLSQSYWNAGDDYGRIKVVIAEGFARDNLTYPFERVKNIVSFSFQHAPLDVLEASSIAWPNAAMWRQVSLIGPYFAHHNTPRQASDIIDAHSHSPRRTVSLARPLAPTPIGSMPPLPVTIFSRHTAYDPFTEHVNAAFSGWRQASVDVSMPDYSNLNTRTNSSRQVTDPMSIVEDRRLESMVTPNVGYESVCEALIPSAPDNTPQNGEDKENTPGALLAIRKPSLRLATKPITVKHDIDEFGPAPTIFLGTSLTNSIKSRKENLGSPHGAGATSTSIHKDGGSRNVSQQASGPSNSGGNKRQRVIPSAASKVIDDEDEPRSSPLLRKISRPGALQEIKEGERRVLSEKNI